MLPRFQQGAIAADKMNHAQALLLAIVQIDAVREFANKSAASAASPDYVKFQAVIKSAASAASAVRPAGNVSFSLEDRNECQKNVKKVSKNMFFDTF